MDNNKEIKQSDILRDKAGDIDSLMLFTDILIILCGVILFFVFCFDSFNILMAGILLVAVLICIYANNVILSSKAAYYKNQAEMLDVLKEINDKMK